MALGVIEKFYPEGRVRRGIQASQNVGTTATTENEGNHGIILQIVWAGDIVAVVICCDAARTIEGNDQIDAKAAIREDGVTQDGVVNRAVATDNYAGVTYAALTAVEGDDVTRTRDRAAHGCIMTGNEDALVVAQRLCACDIRADDVALNKCA